MFTNDQSSLTDKVKTGHYLHVHPHVKTQLCMFTRENTIRKKIEITDTIKNMDDSTLAGVCGSVN